MNVNDGFAMLYIMAHTVEPTAHSHPETELSATAMMSKVAWPAQHFAAPAKISSPHRSRKSGNGNIPQAPPQKGEITGVVPIRVVGTNLLSPKALWHMRRTVNKMISKKDYPVTTVVYRS